ncbi:hypothetical protein ACFQ4K_04010 [Tistrella bauzanensis]
MIAAIRAGRCDPQAAGDDQITDHQPGRDMMHRRQWHDAVWILDRVMMHIHAVVMQSHVRLGFGGCDRQVDQGHIVQLQAEGAFAAAAFWRKS